MKSSQHRYRPPLSGPRAVCGWLLLLLAAGSAVAAAAVPAYRVEDLSAYGSDGDTQAAGTSTLAGNQTWRAFRAGYPLGAAPGDGAMQDLGTLGGSISQALGINDAGALVGSSTTAGDQAARAFLFTDPAGMVDLNRQIDRSAGWELLQATGINVAGQIVGIGRHDGESRGFRLTPLD